MIIHHSASPIEWTSVYDINRWHKNRGFRESRKGYNVGYHYVIERKRTIKCREEDEEGAHTIGGNNQIGVCLTGNFEHDIPTFYQMFSLFKIMLSVDEEITMHKDHANTKCPGKNLIEKVNMLINLKRLINLRK